MKINCKKATRIMICYMFINLYKVKVKMEILKSITSETILEALHIVTKRKDFIIRNRNLANDVYFYTSDHYALNILKETWSIIIENEFYKVTPAFFKKENIEQRKDNEVNI